MVDVILSEWMGYFLLFENMIESYILAIKTLLKSGGATIPSEASIHLHAASRNTEVEEKYKAGAKNRGYKLAVVEE
jgi:hypothetical protein